MFLAIGGTNVGGTNVGWTNVCGRKVAASKYWVTLMLPLLNLQPMCFNIHIYRRGEGFKVRLGLRFSTFWYSLTPKSKIVPKSKLFFTQVMMR